MASMRGTDKQEVRVAMVGAGNMANRVHYPSLASFEDVEIAAICDLDPVRLNETADRYHVEKRYKDYQRMVKETGPDGIYVIGLPDVMFPVWVWCLEQGLNLYIEKPFGITLHQARVLAHLAEKHDCITQVGFQRRHSYVRRHQAGSPRCRKRSRRILWHALCEQTLAWRDDDQL